MATCTECQRPVMWLRHVTTNRAAPIDMDATADGNIVVGDGTYEVLSKERLATYRAEAVPLHTSHFATCPHADRIKQRTEAKQREEQPPIPPPAMSLFEGTGEQQRDDAIERVTDHADSAWLALAFDAVVGLAFDRESFTTDDVWHRLDGVNPPHEPRAMGSVMKRAQREGVIEATKDFIPTTRPQAHAAPVRVWRSLRVPAR